MVELLDILPKDSYSFLRRHWQQPIRVEDMEVLFWKSESPSILYALTKIESQHYWVVVCHPGLSEGCYLCADFKRVIGTLESKSEYRLHSTLGGTGCGCRYSEVRKR